MNKLIGIRGHRGAGKESVTYLIAKTLQYINDTNASSDSDPNRYTETYKQWIQELVDDKNSAFSNIDLNCVYIDSFGDAPKAMVQQLLGCDFKYLWDEYWKDHVVVDLKTFDIEEVNELPEGLMSPDDLPNYVPGCFNDDRWTGDIKMTLRDFILYFGINIMQKYFGQDVWVKSTAQNDKMNEGFEEGFRIYSDIKAPTELTYVINRGGKIINVERKGRKKIGGMDLLKGDDRYDYLVSIKNDDLMSIKDTIWEITNKLYYDEENSKI